MFCDACGKLITDGTGVGRAILCRTCFPDVMAEIERHREAGKPTDAITIARQIFRETHSVGSYLLPDIPEQLWIAAKYKAVDEGLTMRELILKVLPEYIPSCPGLWQGMNALIKHSYVASCPRNGCEVIK